MDRLTTDQRSPMAALLFIDSNLYLDLFRTASGRKLLAPLNEQAGNIFVTSQVVHEVARRKLEVVVTFLVTQFKRLELRNFQVPDHLFGSTGDQSNQLRRKLQDLHDQIAAANTELDALAKTILNKVARSEDEVSRSLIPVFERAVQPQPGELVRARERKELGNPPGKKGDPLGDQLTWEQILSAVEGKTHVWILTRDGDFASEYGSDALLNPALFAELNQRRPGIEVRCFRNIPDGIADFAATTHAKAEELPTKEEVDEIKKEQDALPPIGKSIFVGPQSMRHQPALSAWFEAERAEHEAVRNALSHHHRMRANLVAQMPMTGQPPLPLTAADEAPRSAETGDDLRDDAARR